MNDKLRKENFGKFFKRKVIFQKKIFHVKNFSRGGPDPIGPPPLDTPMKGNIPSKA